MTFSDIQHRILSILEAEKMEAGQRTVHTTHCWLPGHLIARRVKLSARHARAALIKLAAAGLVKRNEKYSGCNTTCWEITEFGSQALKGQRHDK